MIFLARFDEALRERVFDRRIRDHPRCCRAALAGGTEGAAVDGDGGFIQIGISHDDNRVLAAHFAGHLCAALRRFNVERAADFVGAGERYRRECTGN